MSEPVRLQLSRRKGFRLQEHSRAVNGLEAVKVDRTTNWGNPYSDAPADLLVSLFRDHMKCEDSAKAKWKRANINVLRGKNLACWCKPGDPCHADVLLELANGRASGQLVAAHRQVGRRRAVVIASDSA